MKQKILLSTILLLMISIQFIPVNASQSVVIENNETEIYLTIIYANYLDADLDGLSDDTIGFFNLDISSSFYLVYFGLDIMLTLPSGFQFLFNFGIITKAINIGFMIIMLNTAIEPGWYDLEITVTLNRGGFATGTAIYTFDPPSVSGNDPV